MSNINAEDVIAGLGNMTVLELIALTKELEQKWGIEAKPQVSIQAPTNKEPEIAKPAQTEFTIVLASYPADKKIALVKLVRELTGLGLVESKNLVEGAPKPIKEGISIEEVDAMKTRLVEAGAVIEVR